MENENKVDDDNYSTEQQQQAVVEPVPVPVKHRPIKRARTAYFIFRDDKNAEIRASLPGSTMATQAKAVGQAWSELKPEEKQVYQERAAEERERVSAEIKAMEEAGLMPPLASGGNDSLGQSSGLFDLILPVARMRKIAKLDPEVRGIGKEAISVITFATELFTKKLGLEVNRIAQIQNRRKLLPEDVAEACSTREQFVFLKEDVRDLQRELLTQKKELKRQKDAADDAEKEQNPSSKPITSFFSSNPAA